jgi:NAD-dependent deacetylase
MESDFARLRARLEEARAVVVLTGAGISAESGIPTFRDALTGIWSRYRPEELATPEAFRRNPRRVWEWYAERRERVEGVRPNAGHAALARLEGRVVGRGGRFTLVTQNVDGLHRAAGSRSVIELHGNIRRVKCFDHGHPATEWPVATPGPPPCGICGSPLRPDVVWFGEMLSEEALDAAVAASRACDVFLSVGTSGLVEPAASLPYEALGHGATVVEINPERTPLSGSTQRLQGRAGEVLPRLVPEAA